MHTLFKKKNMLLNMIDSDLFNSFRVNYILLYGWSFTGVKDYME